MSIESLSRRLAKVERARTTGRNTIRCVRTIITESEEDQAAQTAARVRAGTYDPTNPTHLLVAWRVVELPACRRPHA